MTYHLSSEHRIRIKPRSAVTIPTRNAFAQAVDLATVMRRNSGESASLQNTGLNTAGTINTGNVWFGQPQFNAEEVNYFHLAPDGTFREGAEAIKHGRDAGVQGFMLDSRELFYDLVMTPAQTGDPAASGDNFEDWHYEVLSGSTVNGATAWRTVGSAGDIKARRITHLAQNSGLVEVRSVETAPANQSFRFDIGFRGIHQARRSTPYLRLMWGEKTYSLLLASNAQPILQRWVSDPNFNNGVPGWAPWHKLNNAPKIRMSGPGAMRNLIIRVRSIGGFLVLDFDTGGAVTKIWVADAYYPPTTPGEPNAPEPILRDITWPEGRYNIEMDGMQATIGYAAIVYRDALTGTQFSGLEGTFTQTIYTSYAPSGGSVPGEGKTAGWAKRGTSTEVEATWSANSGGTVALGGKIDVTVTLRTNVIPYAGASAAGASAAGTDTPVVLRYVVSSAPPPTPPAAAYIEIQDACCGQWSIDVKEPDSGSISTARLTFDRQRLDDIEPTWDTILDDGSPITWEQRWLDSDGSYTSWTMLFNGYIANRDYETDAVNSQMGTLYCIDKSLFLKEPWGMIDQRFLPLDHLAMESGQAIYDADGVEYIIRTIFGDDEADAINGNGDPMRYLPDDHYALIDGLNNTGGVSLSLSTLTLQPPTTNGFLYPPPFNRSAQTWIDELREKARTVVYYGIPPGGSSYCFVYGRLDLIEAAQDAVGTQQLDDTNYTSASLDRLIEQASIHTLPDTSYNVCRIIFGPGVEGSKQGILLPFYVVESRLPDGDTYNSPANTGERVLCMEFDWLLSKNAAQTMADVIITEFREVKHQTVQITSRGVASANFGRLIIPKMDGTFSDSTIGLDGLRLRTMHLTHGGNFDDWSFRTAWHARPTSYTGT